MKEEGQASRGKLFWRIQKVCFTRAVTPYLMYLFMSLIMLVCQLIGDSVWMYLLSILCMLGGMAYNAHLTYHYGADHYGAYVAGCLHRQNQLFGIQSGGDHRVEREYRPYKGFLIGFYVGLPVIIVALIAGSVPALNSTGEAFLDMFAGWAIIPFQWIRDKLNVNLLYLSMVMIVIPITVSGIFYIVGAKTEKRKRDQEAERQASVLEASERIRAQQESAAAERRRKQQQQNKKKKH